MHVRNFGSDCRFCCKLGNPVASASDEPITLPTCELCKKNDTSPLKSLGGTVTSSSKWVHLICAVWYPHSFVRDIDTVSGIVIDEGSNSSCLKGQCNLCWQGGQGVDVL